MDNRLLFIISHQPNPRFIKQINYFAQNGFKVSVIYFHRDYLADQNNSIDSSVDLYLLDKIENGKYLKRVFIYLKSIFKLKYLLKNIKPTKIIVTNIDILFLLIINNIKLYTKDIAMEISDLRSYTFNTGTVDKLQQYIDTLVLNKYITKMIFTSPKFYEFYYKKKFKGKIFILENKPLSNMMPPVVEKVQNKKLVIGIVGLLLDGKPHKALFEYAKDQPDIEIYIYGKGVYEDQAKEYSQKYGNIKYFGEYSFFNDIAKIYASLDIIYMSYDTSGKDLNINLALPNKLYEAMYFKVPVITTEGTYLAQRVLENHIGYTIRCCNLDDIKDVVENYKLKNDIIGFDDIKDELFLGDDDYKRLISFI